jgi:hypothetical protein
MRAEDWVPMDGPVINPLKRHPISEPLDVRIRSINGLLTVGRGQRRRLRAQRGAQEEQQQRRCGRSHGVPCSSWHVAFMPQHSTRRDIAHGATRRAAALYPFTLSRGHSPSPGRFVTGGERG